jgi:hypothetical protein
MVLAVAAFLLSDSIMTTRKMLLLLGLALTTVAPTASFADRGTTAALRKQILASAKQNRAWSGVRPSLKLVRQGNTVTATIYSMKGGGVSIQPQFRDAVERATFNIMVGLDGQHAVLKAPWKNIWVPRP